MGEGEEEILQATCSVPRHVRHAKHDQWMIMEGDNDDTNSTSSLDNSTTSNGSTASSDVVDDASSSSSCSPTNSNGPLYELSELMTHLPIKRGLSNYYQGKCQSFTSLSRVTSIEDLAKKETPYRRKMKASKSYGNGLDAYKLYTLPKAIISKKVSKGCLTSLSFVGRRGNFPNSSRPPPVPVLKKF